MMFRLFQIALACLGVAFGLSGGATAQELPDEWQSFMSHREGAVVIVMSRANLADALVSRRESVWVFSVALQSQTENNLPDGEEFDRLAQLDMLFDQIEADSGSPSLGRVTGQGRRQYFYLAESGEKLTSELARAAGSLGYESQVRQEREARAIFDKYLAPTPEEERGIKDQQVLQQLEQAGDFAERARQVDHWAYFPDRVAAGVFAKWAMENGYRVLDITEVDYSLPFMVHSAHEGTMLPDDILAKTLAQFRKTRELSGIYDGWETAVMR
jgi:Regulator of ribonuclease activity B/Family of unknown function (DUF695)